MMLRSSSLLLVAVLGLGCADFQGPGQIRARSSGDANQDTVTCEGPCEISTTTDEAGAVGWKVKTGKGGVATWHQGSSANADLYVDLVRAGVEAAASGASPAP